MRSVFSWIAFFSCIFMGLYSCHKRAVGPGPDWDTVKAGVFPVVMFPDEYEAPYPLDISTLGWEDGQFITRDGLTLYCFYTPMDLLAFVYIGGGEDPCDVGPYVRGPFPEILETVPLQLEGVCDRMLNADLLISHRDSMGEPFPAWQISNISFPAGIEGAPQLVLNDSNPAVVDYFVFTYLNFDEGYGNEFNDIALYRNVGRNPEGPFEILPMPINGLYTTEDNPHLERLAADELVLFFTSADRPGGLGDVDIYFSISHDGGLSWEQVEAVNFNSSDFEDMPHLWRDTSGVYWLYYMDKDNNIARRKQMVPGNWKDWGASQTVLDKGSALAVGEPTLTQWGDVIFGLIYDAGTGWGTDNFNRFDNDVWVLPKKGSPFY